MRKANPEPLVPLANGLDRPIALGRKKYHFMGSANGSRAAAIAYTLIETAKLNGVESQVWPVDDIDRIPDY